MSTTLSGSYVGNASNPRTITSGMSAAPAMVIIIRVATTTISNVVWKLSGMTIGGDYSRFWNNTTVGNQIQLDANGFTLINSISGTNNNNETHHWIAVTEDNVEVESGNYSGDGVDGRNITTSFQPDMVMVQAKTIKVVNGWFASKGGDNTYELTNVGGDSGPLTNRVISVAATNFRVGAALNSAILDYHWIAFKDAGLGGIIQSTYTGDGVDGLAVDVGNQLIDGAMVIRDDGGPVDDEEVLASVTSVTGSHKGETTRITDGITAFALNIFNLGTNAAINTSGQLHHYITWGNLALPFDGGIIGTPPAYVPFTRSPYTPGQRSKYQYYKSAKTLTEMLRNVRLS